jgi:hypothetical protein
MKFLTTLEKKIVSWSTLSLLVETNGEIGRGF